MLDLMLLYNVLSLMFLIEVTKSYNSGRMFIIPTFSPNIFRGKFLMKVELRKPILFSWTYTIYFEIDTSTKKKMKEKVNFIVSTYINIVSFFLFYLN